MQPSLHNFFYENPELHMNAHDFNISVATNHGDRIESEMLFDEFKHFDGAKNDTHLYLHLPLCEYICYYCNYVKRKIGDDRGAELRQWADLLIQESEIYLRQVDWMNRAPIRSFYIGGGTAALLLTEEPAIRKIMTHFTKAFRLSDDCEITIEGNPENFTAETLRLAKDVGFNRYSVGVQSLEEDVNSFAHRGHSSNQAMDAIRELLATGRPFSVDIMFGLPLQTPESVSRDVQSLINLGVPSISLYRLRNAEREKMGLGNASVWNKEVAKQQLDSSGVLPSAVDAYSQRRAITKLLTEADYEASPCSWWNKRGLYPDGNIARFVKDKWQKYNTMLAFGPGAYGWLSGSSSRFFQTHNLSKISQYIDYMNENPSIPPLAYGRMLEGSVAVGTKLTFAFRANQPISVGAYRAQFGVDLLSDEPYASVFEALLAKGFVTGSDDGDWLRPTALGEEFHEEIQHVYLQNGIGAAEGAACRRAASA